MFEFFQDDALDERGYFENRANPANPRRRNQFGFQIDGPFVLPKLYDGRNKTFFLGAYEGVRGEGLSSPIVTVPTALMRQGNFSEISGTIRNPFTGQPYPGNIIPAAQLSAIALKILEFYPAPNRPGIASNLQNRGSNEDNIDQILVRVDQNVGKEVRLSVRYNWHDSFNINSLNAALQTQVVTQPRVNHNTLVSYTHTLAPNLVQRLPDRLPPRRFRHSERVGSRGNLTPTGSDLGIPGFDGDVQYEQPGHSEHQHQRLQRARWRRHELVSIRHDVPGVERAGLHERIAQSAGRLRPPADGHRPARGKRSAGPVRFQWRHDRACGRGFHAGASAHGDSADRSNPGPRRRLAQRLFRERRLAGDAGADVEPGLALRVEHPRADLRGARVDAG